MNLEYIVSKYNLFLRSIKFKHYNINKIILRIYIKQVLLNNLLIISMILYLKSKLINKLLMKQDIDYNKNIKLM